MSQQYFITTPTQATDELSEFYTTASLKYGNSPLSSSAFVEWENLMNVSL
jgi:hypothetical protein